MLNPSTVKCLKLKYASIQNTPFYVMYITQMVLKDKLYTVSKHSI